MWIEVALVVMAAVVLAVVLTSVVRPDPPARGAASGTSPDGTGGGGLAVGSDDLEEVMTMLQDKSAKRPNLRNVTRRRVAAEIGVEIRALSGNFAARVLDYSVDGSGLSVLGTATVHRGDRVRVALPQHGKETEVTAEVCHPIGQVAVEEWVVGLFFPDVRDRLHVLDYLREVTREGRTIARP